MLSFLSDIIRSEGSMRWAGGQQAKEDSRVVILPGGRGLPSLDRSGQQACVDDEQL